MEQENWQKSSKNLAPGGQLCIVTAMAYWRPAEIAPKGPARKANCGAKEKAITEFFQILYTELALNSACRAAYFRTYNLSPRKYLHLLADKGRQQ